jgi:hypothetical protein
MRIAKITAVAASAALLLTACGGGPLDGKTGTEVAEAAAAALEKAGSVQVTGSVQMEGEEGEVDLFLSGENASGTLTMGGADIELIQVDGTAYMKAPADFWSSFGMPAEATSMFEGEWVLVPAEAASGFEEFSLDGFIEELRNPDTAIEEDVEEGEVDGQEVVIVKQEDGSELAVANDDNSYPLEINNKGESEGTLTFSRFGDDEEITAPDDAIDLTELMGS